MCKNYEFDIVGFEPTYKELKHANTEEIELRDKEF